MSSALPLSGVRVLDFTWVGAGPIGTKILAEFGAEVIKVESRSRPDPLRRTGPFAPGTDPLERSGYFADRNPQKSSISLDLTHPRARDVVLRLATVSDVCAQSFRPGTMEKWRLGYEELTEVRPDLIYLAMPMQGESGPHSTFSGFGATLVALCGLHELCGYPDREPVGTGTNYPDHVPNPLHAVFAVLGALRHRALTGQGQRIELSQLESTINVIGPAIEAAALGHAPIRDGNRIAHAVPHGVFPAAGDDRWVAIAVMDDRQWRGLAGATGLDSFAADRWSTFEGRLASRDTIESQLADWTSALEPDEIEARLVRSGVPVSVVRNAGELLEGASGLRARGAFETLPHPVMGDTIYTATTPRLSRTPGRLDTPAPLLGQQTDTVLQDLLGMSISDIASLRDDGVLA
ncbi:MULTISPECIES: CaiB/BaiF CoA-transferase family protein [unclassified Microbacterium]|uniref:CaiB/BaiF CoA transferase family protein n=1 Tax=unclassified Microbacterium TaxID=2609290 RepID=UPI000C5FE214|nr:MULTISPECIES: CoA transferase [unclassified Microbacterium]MBU19033.1 carnitine dehydratase [Microbacterium sp.]HBU42935.1 carnitine dehydratase [Microbacterium sp.]|tara:strand:+ start:3868 stop:5085 length:1218 start_codon:yes stop_codon:yes gene_type:complete